MPNQATQYGYSRIQSFEKCPKCYYYQYELGLSQKSTNLNTLFGTVLHAARRRWYETEKDLSAAVETIRDELVDYTAEPDFIVVDFALYACDAMAAYAKQYEGDKVEHVTFELPFETTIGEFPFTGRLDGIVVIDGMVWVEEFKTTGLPLTTFLRNMQVDGKTTGYVWAARKLADPRVQGAYLDVLYKRRNKSGFDFARDVSPRSDEFLAMWERNTIAKLQDIQRCHKTGFWPHNYSSCYNMWGVCPYVDLCRFGERPELLAQFRKEETLPQEGGVTNESGNT